MSRSILNNIWRAPRCRVYYHTRYSTPPFLQSHGVQKAYQSSAAGHTVSSTSLGPNNKLLATVFAAISLPLTFYLMYNPSAKPPVTKSRNKTATQKHDDEECTRSIAPLDHQPRPKWDLTPANVAAAKKELISLLGQENVSDDPATRVAHSETEWSESPNGGAIDRPSLIVYPHSTEDVSAIARICHRHHIPMIGFSGGTSLEGALAAVNHEICVDFCRMDAIIAVHEEDMDAVVQPGLSHNVLNAALEEKGLFFPPDPGPGACIGGMVAQGCSGTNAFRYGPMRDWVLGLTVVLADGTIIRTRARPRKSSAGYDLTRLFVGSEGTLGFVTEARIKLAARPTNLRVAVAGFPSLSEAVATTIQLVREGHQLEAMELLDTFTMRAVNRGGYTKRQWPEKPTLFLKFAGTTTGAVEEQITTAQRIAGEHGCDGFTCSTNEEEVDELWAARKTALWSLLALKHRPEDKFLSADSCVPVSRLGDIIAATTENIEASGLLGSCLGHVGDGNFHATVLFSEEEREEARAVIIATQKIGIKLDGTVSGEHGIGLTNRDALTWELGEDSIAAMRQIKNALDPLWLMNPGKVFRLWEGQE